MAFLLLHNYTDFIFLEKERNSDILRKHYKLWLHSTGILSELYNQNIFIDCESLLSNIDIEKKIFY